MAIKTYRVRQGTHSIPNPHKKSDNDPSHIEVQTGETFQIEEERAVQHTKGWDPRLVEVPSAAHVEEIKSAPAKEPEKETFGEKLKELAEEAKDAIIPKPAAPVAKK